jgi:hypothetical protein
MIRLKALEFGPDHLDPVPEVARSLEFAGDIHGEERLRGVCEHSRDALPERLAIGPGDDSTREDQLALAVPLIVSIRGGP